MADVTISPVEAGDAGEILTLQRAAYVTEAQLYGDPFLPALTQTYQELRAELAEGFALKATCDTRIIGVGRARQDGPVWHIGRLTIAPDAQGQGIGTRLLTELERSAPAGVESFALFTGHLSVANIRLYERLGYREERRETLRPGVDLVHLAKHAGR
ncbi:GNAT family N-acetyltransferase [Catenulispora subtropica]|uniref:GNAT family N-acetyltransferase n=1 Tax=Catenulispora subtropica TaxID=450798 RepID=A0ABP5ECB4_9ACTN